MTEASVGRTVAGVTHRALSILSVFFVACATTPAPAPRPDFDAALAEHVRTIRERDLVGYERTITERESFSIIFPNGHRTTKRAEAIAFHREWFADTAWQMSFEEAERIDGGDSMVVVFRTAYRDAPDGEDREGWLTLVFAVEGGAWRLVHDQNTRIAPK